MMSIYDLMNMFCDGDMQEINLFELYSGESVYCGEYGDMPDEFQDVEVSSIDNLDGNVLVINIEL